MGFYISKHVITVKSAAFHKGHFSLFFSSPPSTMIILLRRHSTRIGPPPTLPYTPTPSQYIIWTPWVPPYHRVYRLVPMFHPISNQPPPNFHPWCVIFHPIFHRIIFWSARKPTTLCTPHIWSLMMRLLTVLHVMGMVRWSFVYVIIIQFAKFYPSTVR